MNSVFGPRRAGPFSSPIDKASSPQLWLFRHSLGVVGFGFVHLHDGRLQTDALLGPCEWTMLHHVGIRTR